MKTLMINQSTDERYRVIINRYVGRDLGCKVEDDHDIDLIVDDVLSQWRDGESPGDLWERYANAVEYAPPGSPNEYREGFAEEGADLDTYLHAVWEDRLEKLRSGG